MERVFIELNYVDFGLQQRGDCEGDVRVGGLEILVVNIASSVGC